MKLNNSNKRYSNYIAGILVLTLLFILMGFLIGCWGCCTNEKVGTPSVFPLNSNFNTGNINREPAAQSPQSWFLDTERGTLTVTDAGFYDINDALIVNMTSGAGQFPLCITKSDGYYFNFTVETCGGYSPFDIDPYDLCNYIELKQCKWPDTWHKYRLHYTADNWTWIGSDTCCDFWNLTVHVDADHYLEEMVSWCNWQETDSICFESNHPADDCSKTLCKEVDVKLKTLWSGCLFEEQSFCCVRKWYNLDTECGTMTILDKGIHDIDEFEFDLCYDASQGLVIGHIFLHVEGGYRPNDNDNITFVQSKGTDVYQLYRLEDTITWYEYDDPDAVAIFDSYFDAGELDAYVDGCCETVFVGVIKFEDQIIGIDDVAGVPEAVTSMKFASNHPPLCCYGDFTLDKEVEVIFESEWEGCCLEPQEFTYMLVHKNNISGVPNSRNFIAS
jgi:hypothetical protein